MTSGGAASDGVAVRFQASSGDGLMNCLGGTHPGGGAAAEVWINTYQINGQNELTCSFNGATPVPLAANVQRMRIEYGVDFDGNGSNDSYLPASVVTASGPFAPQRNSVTDGSRSPTLIVIILPRNRP